jgi:hypothetical protein
MKNAKILSLGVIALACLVVDWFLINSALANQRPLFFWFWPTMLSALTITVLTFFFSANFHGLYSRVLVLLAMLGYVLIMPKNLYVWAGGLIFFLLVLLFEHRVRVEENGRADFSINKVLSAGHNIMVYAFLILLGMNIYSHTSQDFKNNPDAFYNRLGESAAKSLPFFSKGLGKNLDLSQTLDSYLMNQAAGEEPGIENLPSAQKQQYLNISRTELLRQFQVNALGNETLSQIIARFLTDKIRTQFVQYGAFFPLIFTLIIVALLRMFAFLFNWLTSFLTWGLFRLLLMFNFFRLVLVPVEVKKLEI